MTSTIRGNDNFDSSQLSPTNFNSGAVGTYAYLTWTSNGGYAGGSGITHGTSYAGSNFEYGVLRHGADIDCNAYSYNTGTPSGTWKCIGSAGANSHMPKTLYFRVA